MAYDYNSQDARLDVQNPYKIENFFHFCASGILIASAVILFFITKKSLTASSPALAVPLLFGIVMLVHGMMLGGRALSRLRFYFGRGRPTGLAPELSPDQTGCSAQANRIKENMRHSSLAFKEPQGALNGALYYLFPNLIFSPAYIQSVAQRQFHNAMALSAAFLSLLVSMIFADPTSAGWLGLSYFVLAVFVLLKPVDHGASGAVELNTYGIVALFLSAILGPVLIAKVALGFTAPDWLPGYGLAAFVMTCALASIGLFFRAVISQSQSAHPQATMAMVQDAVSHNAHPKQVLDEFERKMQDAWVASLPNRVYSRILPEISINKEAGAFVAEALQETQPVPRGDGAGLNLKNCFYEPRVRWLSILNAFGLAMLFGAAIALVYFAAHWTGSFAVDKDYATSATLGAALWMLGNFCFRAGGILWGRFDFVSKVIWVEMSGNYQAAKLDFGNQFTDRVRSNKRLINVETMTLRVWVAEIDTVAFGKDSKRSILAMRGLKDEAQGLHRVLREFALQQSVLVTPSSHADLKRVKASGRNRVSPAAAVGTLAATLAAAVNQ